MPSSGLSFGDMLGAIIRGLGNNPNGSVFGGLSGALNSVDEAQAYPQLLNAINPSSPQQVNITPSITGQSFGGATPGVKFGTGATQPQAPNPLGLDASAMPLLRSLPPQLGMPLLMQTAQSNMPTPQTRYVQSETAKNNVGLAQLRGQMDYFRQLEGKQPMTDQEASAMGFPASSTYSASNAVQPQQSLPAAPKTSAPLDAGQFFNDFVLPHEGSNYVTENGVGSKFGVSQTSFPTLNIKNLTADKAQNIFQNQYFTPSGADHLPAPLAAVQADTAYNMGPQAANSLLAQSGGDPMKYLQLRQAQYQQIAQSNPAKAQFLPGWTKRNQDLAQYVQSIGGGAQPNQASQGQQGQGGMDLAGIGQFDPSLAIGLMAKQSVLMSPAEQQQYNALPGSTISHLTGEVNRATPGNSSPNYSPEELRGMAQAVMRTGPSALMGRDQETARMVNQTLYGPVSQGGLRPDNVDPDTWGNWVVNARMGTKARQQAGDYLAKQQTATQVAESAVVNSMNILKPLLAQLPSGGITDWNSFELAVKQHFNNADAVKINNAIETLGNEYARVISGTTTGAGSSDAARNEAHSYLLHGYSGGTMDAAMQQMVQEMDGKTQTQMAGLQTLLGDAPTGMGYSGIQPTTQYGNAPLGSPTASGPKAASGWSIKKL